VALRAHLQPIEFAPQAVATVHAATGGRIACASGADIGKVQLQLRKVGLMGYFEGRCFSGMDCAHTKPAPDVYLAAAQALGVAPDRCAVVEDTPIGVTAGVAAGATVFGFASAQARVGMADELKAAGAVETFVTMQQLVALLR
jgi:beta-phosphoglucomutase-like phosphatase (HAD superfamily)